MDIAAEAVMLVEKIKPMLAGRHPAVQSAVIANLLTMFLVGFPRFARDDILKRILEVVEDLTPIEEEDIYGGAGHPQDRQ